MSQDTHDTVRPIEWGDEGVWLLDQRLLPLEKKWILCRDVAGVADAIRDMVVRGAPAIGITAAYGAVLAARARYERSPATWRQDIDADLKRLAETRPTAVNLFWALERMRRVVQGGADEPVAALLEAARGIHQADIAANRTMGRLGAELIESPGAVLTHCNAGSLATGGYGTALGVVRAGFAAGRVTQVYADETRPWLQGARLTAWELLEDGIPVTLIAEGAGAHLMKQGALRWLIVGSDRIAANGDVANKIGTYHAALAARHHGVGVMVVAPTSTVDMSVPNGAAIPIESRAEDELLALGGRRIAAPGARAWNPVFDVTPAELVDAIVTERGVVRAPTTTAMARMMGEPAAQA